MSEKLIERYGGVLKKTAEEWKIYDFETDIHNQACDYATSTSSDKSILLGVKIEAFKAGAEYMRRKLDNK